MDIRQLEVFLKVAELSSFSKAADILNISQPTVSAHIQNLESELGIRLFDRSGRKVLLTPEGKVLVKYAKEIIKKRDEALARVLSKSEDLSGTLKIAASNIPGEYFIPSILIHVKRTMPSVTLNVDVYDTRRVIAILMEDIPAYEIGFVGSAVDEKNLECREIFKDELVLIAPFSYRPSVVTVDDLLKMPIVLRERGSGSRESFERALKKMGLDISDLNVVAVLGNNTAVKEAVVKGSRYSVRSEIRCKLLKEVSVKDFNVRRSFYAVRRRDITPSPPARKFWSSLPSFLRQSEMDLFENCQR